MPIPKHARMSLLLAAASVCVSAVAVLAHGPSDEDLEQRHYCEMVALHKKDASTGWPDYNHNYAEVCEGEQHAR